jgi:hypothetical protein
VQRKREKNLIALVIGGRVSKKLFHLQVGKGVLKSPVLLKTELRRSSKFERSVT